MKRLRLFLFIGLLCPSLLFAVSNTQKIYPIESEAYQAISYLYISQGYALPSTSGPWSSDELLKMVDKIDERKLNGDEQIVYKYVLSNLRPESKVFGFSFDTAIEGYIHTNKVDFVREDQWIRGYNERKPLLDLALETWVTSNLYGYSAITIQPTKTGEYTDDGEFTTPLFGSSIFASNLFFIPPGKFGYLDFNIPYRAFVALGGNNWSAQIGRDKTSWGGGISGNLMLGDHLKYHNMGRFTTYRKNFKYTLLASFFPHPENYYHKTPLLKNDGSYDLDAEGNIQYEWEFDPKSGSRHPLTGLNMFLGHRLEWRMFKDKVGFALSEAMIYQSNTGALDLQVLNPAGIFHNYYIRANSNSILTLEVDYTPIKYLNIYGQIAIDEFAMPGLEAAPGVADKANPSALGYLAGVKSSYPFKKGMFYGSLEGAYTNPYLYLRDKGDYVQSLGQPGINMVVAIRERFGDGAVYYDEAFLGYKYGPDAVVVNANAGYKQFGKWYAETNFFFMLHGTHDKWTTWSYVYNEDEMSDFNDVEIKPPYLSTPTTEHWTYNNGDPTARDRDAMSKTFVATFKGAYTILRGFDVYGQADFVHVINPGNLKNNDPISDFQFTFGVSYSL